MRLGTAVVEPPGPGELRLRVQACGLNPVDWKIAAIGVASWSWPHVPGLDIVGTVTDVGPGVDGSRIGELVAVHHDLTKPGGLAGAAVVSDAAAAALQPGTDPVLAAPRLGCAPFTTAPTLVELALGAVYSHGSEGDLRSLAAALARLVDGLNSGQLKPPRHDVGSLAEAPEMLQAMADGTGPKAIIRIDES